MPDSPQTTAYLIFAYVFAPDPAAIPVALAMWNQVTSEVILFVRTYAFFKRNNYILTLLVVALAGVVAYQLYVDTTSLPTRDGAMPSNVQASFGASVRLPPAPRMCCSLSKCYAEISFRVARQIDLDT
ncbi:hypothetical protein BC835DRAFT_1418670 [Cytidiella melzeri]|nr:hypothetical protein BC835DRAFT_1418670 [Cytidiella melzeri]